MRVRGAAPRRISRSAVVNSPNRGKPRYRQAEPEGREGRAEHGALTLLAFCSHAEARTAIFRFIEGWYNPHRRHSALSQQSPITYERTHALNHSQRVSDAA